MQEMTRKSPKNASPAQQNVKPIQTVKDDENIIEDIDCANDPDSSTENRESGRPQGEKSEADISRDDEVSPKEITHDRPIVHRRRGINEPPYPGEENQAVYRESIDAPPLKKRRDTNYNIVLYNLLSYGSGCVLMAIGLILIIVMSSLLSSGGKRTCIRREVNSTNIGSLSYERLNAYLPKQSKSFWITLDIEMTRIVDEGGKPSCILLTYPQTDRSRVHPTLDCINQHVNYLLSGNETNNVFKAADYKSRSNLEDLFEGLHENQVRSSVLMDINYLSLDSAKIFYKVCDDNLNPAYPGTLLFLTLARNQEDVSAEWVEDKLAEDWSVTKRHSELLPIMSRIPNMVEINLKTGGMQNPCSVTDLCIENS